MITSPIEVDPLLSFQHAIMLGGVLVPVFVMWFDNRRQSAIRHEESMKQSEKMHDETEKQNAELHRENQNRLLKIETQLEPLYAWWLSQSMKKGDD
jgi:hypothetical protein